MDLALSSGFRLPTKFFPKCMLIFALVFYQKLIIHGDSLVSTMSDVNFVGRKFLNLGKPKSTDEKTGFISSVDLVTEIKKTNKSFVLKNTFRSNCKQCFGRTKAQGKIRSPPKKQS